MTKNKKSPCSEKIFYKLGMKSLRDHVFIPTVQWRGEADKYYPLPAGGKYSIVYYMYIGKRIGTKCAYVEYSLCVWRAMLHCQP